MEHWLQQVQELRKAGSFEKTIAALTVELAARPEDPQVHYQIAWTHDALGKEADAAPAYEKAIALGLAGEDLEGAYLGLGSTYRCLGDYPNSDRVLREGIARFPENQALRVFHALTLFNLANYAGSVETLLQVLAHTSADEHVQRYRRAILFYSDKLNQTFE